jgi:hypothetical protein
MAKKLFTFNSAGGAAILFMALAQGASAGTFTMTWTGGDGPGTATLTATPDGTDAWLVGSLTGLQNGLSISLLSGSYGGDDDFIYQPTDTWLVDFDGLAFTDGTNKYDIFSNPGDTVNVFECSSAVESTCIGAQVSSALAVTSLSITPTTASTPEPATAGLVGMTMFGMVGALLRRKRGMESRG